MVTYVLDASAILRFLDGEAGADCVGDRIKGHNAGQNRVIISAVHWGEVAGVIWKRHGIERVNAILSLLSHFKFEIAPASAERAVHSGLIKARQKIPYADALGIDWQAIRRTICF